MTDVGGNSPFREWGVMGVGHPQTCMIDGIMAAIGCTYGKLMMECLGYDKVAAILYAPSNGAVRVYPNRY